jgi:Type II secretion system (T2SS), protein K
MRRPAAPPPPPARRSRRGSILIVVLVTLLFAAAALTTFLERASNDLLVEARAQEAARLRPDAYSALEVTLAVLEDFIYADGALHSPTEGWADPLAWAGWEPADGSTVTVSFEDESGKIPLIHADSTSMMTLFESWGMDQGDAQHLIDVLLQWMQQNYTPVTAVENDYEQSAIPYDPPLRAMRSYGELRAIDYARDVFYDAAGRPNQLWWRFRGDFSLFNYRAPDINGANADVLTAVGQFQPSQEQAIADYLAGRSQLSTLGRTWFQGAGDLEPVVGPEGGNIRAFSYTISALRILITVRQGDATYRLSVVVAPSSGGARTVLTTATDMQKGASNSGTGETTSASSATGAAEPTTSPTSSQTSAASTANIKFPFTILEILENDQIPAPPPPPPPS